MFVLLLSYNLKAQIDTLYYESGQIESIGNIEDNIRHGEWKWYHKNGQLMSIEKYENGVFKNGKFWNEQGDSTTINEIAVLPEYTKRETNGFAKFISKNLRYPVLAMENRIQGQVIVDFNIDKSGNVVDIVIFKSAHEYLDKEAIRVIRKSKKWIPGTLHGKKVKMAMRFPINFQL